MTWKEAQLIFDAGDYLRARGTPVTPAKVESYVRERLAQNGQLLPGASVREIVTAANALTQGDATMKTSESRYAVPQKYFERAHNEVNLDALIPSRPPQSQDEALALVDEMRQLVASFSGLDREQRVAAIKHFSGRQEMVTKWLHVTSADISREAGGSSSQR